MNAFSTHLLDVFHGLICCSFYATILLVIILLIRSIIQRKFRFRVVYWLWMLLLLRLVWPLNVQTTFSVFNLIPARMTPDQYVSAPSVEAHAIEQDSPVESTEAQQPGGLFEPSEVSETAQVTADSSSSLSDQRLSSSKFVFDLPMLLCTVWLTGAGLLGVYVVYHNVRLWRIIKSQRLVTHEGILELLEDCKVQLGLQTVIGVVQTDKIKSPCLFGYLRPRLLLPAGTLEEMTKEQIRYVFLHELAHLKRHDILIGWLMAFVQVLHWFNPAVWYAMTQISRDRELACDELAMSTLKDDEPIEYGSTLLTFLERFSSKQRYPGMAGIAESQSLLRRRMSMIAKFKNKKTVWLPILAVIVLLFATTFTSAKPQKSEPKGLAEATVKTMTTGAPSASSRSSRAKPEILSQDDGKSAGQKSIAGSGHAVFFETDGESELVAVMLYGSRYGAKQPPKEKFHIWLCDMNQEIIKEFQLPYGMFKKGDPKWVKMRVEKTRLPDSFYLCAGFNAEQTKGVFVHYDSDASGNSYTGLPKDGFVEYEQGDWMIRAVTRPVKSSGGSVPQVATKSTGQVETVGTGTSEINSSNLQAVIDAAKPGAKIEIPEGTYEQPITIKKSLRLVGASQGKCIFKVTANQPAIMIDTGGKGEVLVENITIQWQLATSDKHEHPYAIGIKDSKGTINDCKFPMVGDPKRSPIAVYAKGFSEMKVIDCDFTGFDYVVCFGEGTKGSMTDCFIRNCSHQGVILYKGAQATVNRNIITGSKYHAVRVTGGKLDMHDNLIINNKNRGVYLGNKSGSGRIVNNLLIGNASGIDGTSACHFAVENNVILKSTYAAIAARPYSMLMVKDNVLSGSPQGIIVHQKEGESLPVRSKFGRNVFWKNQTDMQNCESAEMISAEPDFIEPGNGNFQLADPSFEGMGLKDPKVIFDLWQKYKEKK